MPTYYDGKRKSWYVKYSAKDPVTGKRKQIMKVSDKFQSYREIESTHEFEFHAL